MNNKQDESLYNKVRQTCDYHGDLLISSNRNQENKYLQRSYIGRTRTKKENTYLSQLGYDLKRGWNLKETFERRKKPHTKISCWNMWLLRIGLLEVDGIGCLLGVAFFRRIDRSLQHF